MDTSSIKKFFTPIVKKRIAITGALAALAGGGVWAVKKYKSTHNTPTEAKNDTYDPEIEIGV